MFCHFNPKREKAGDPRPSLRCCKARANKYRPDSKKGNKRQAPQFGSDFLLWDPQLLHHYHQHVSSFKRLSAESAYDCLLGEKRLRDTDDEQFPKETSGIQRDVLVFAYGCTYRACCRVNARHNERRKPN
jgi:hypothetical protein